jgi:nucleoside-diphosphate-sugar epimerase
MYPCLSIIHGSFVFNTRWAAAAAARRAARARRARARRAAAGRYTRCCAAMAMMRYYRRSAQWTGFLLCCCIVSSNRWSLRVVAAAFSGGGGGSGDSSDDHRNGQRVNQQQQQQQQQQDGAADDVVCVTGASGFIAMELIRQLLVDESHKFNVRGTVRSLTGSRGEDNRNALQNLPGAAERLTLLQADLLDDGAFDECVAGATYVFHTASPFIMDGVADPQQALINPAVKGTENLLRSVVNAGTAKRLVVTSSVAAVKGPGSIPGGGRSCFNEDDWNDSSELSTTDTMESYRVSKTVAERAAWRIAKQAGLEMATVNPAFVLGPPVTPRADSESLKYMKAIIEGGRPTRGDTNAVDVRDVARAHILAAKLPAAAGQRFIMSSRPLVRLADMVRVASALAATILLCNSSCRVCIDSNRRSHASRAQDYADGPACTSHQSDFLFQKCGQHPGDGPASSSKHCRRHGARNAEGRIGIAAATRRHQKR